MSDTERTITYHKVIGGQDALHYQYQGQTRPQPIYLEIDCDSREVRIDWNAEIGNAVPMKVYHQRVLRYSLPDYLSRDAANRALADETVMGLVERIVNGYSCEWGGSNLRGRLDADATVAEELFEGLIDSDCGGMFNDCDLVQVVDAEEWCTQGGDSHADALAALREEIGDATLDSAEAMQAISAWGGGIYYLRDCDVYLERLSRLCEGCGEIHDELAMVEIMPECHRASHVAAGNSGVYPLNGAERVRRCAECAKEMIETDPEWTSIVE